MLTLEACGPYGSPGNLVLTWDSPAVNIYTAPSGGSALTQFVTPFHGFNGTNLHVEGISPGTTTLSWTYSAQTNCTDSIQVRALKIDFKTNELIRPLYEQALETETWLTDDTFEKTRISWSMTKVEGVVASIDQNGDITYGQGAGIYTVRAESSDLSTCYDDLTLMVLDWVLGAHSNVGDGASFLSGHAWISVSDFSQNPASVATFGLWPDDHPLIIQDGLNNGDGTDVRVGREPAYGLHNRYFFLNPTEKQSLVNYINTVFHWTYWYTCASFAEGSVMAATGEDVDADDYLGFETPREFGSSISQIEATEPTDRLNPINGGNVNSSWTSSSFKGSVHDP